MTIAVDKTGLEKGESNVIDVFIKEIFIRLTARHPDDNFILISEHAAAKCQSQSLNVSSIIATDIANTFIKKAFGNRLNISRILKKYNTQILVSSQYFPIKKIPQCFILPEGSFRFSAEPGNKRQFICLNKNTERAVKKANLIICFSEFTKTLTIEKYNLSSDKIQVVHPGSNVLYDPVSTEERERIKEEYSGGFEYFIFSGKISSANNIIHLLKGFSGFKKRQKSSMKLILASTFPISDEGFKKSFSLYRFKEEVVLLPGLTENEIAKITSAAYATIFPAFTCESVMELPNSMREQVPVIASQQEPFPEFCGEAALYFDDNSSEDIALKMMDIFKNEDLRKSIIEKGNTQLEKFSWEIASETFWNRLNKLIKDL
ncbi:MAG: glycosyltransferase [Ginsengibacter sp.]